MRTLERRHRSLEERLSLVFADPSSRAQGLRMAGGLRAARVRGVLVIRVGKPPER